MDTHDTIQDQAIAECMAMQNMLNCYLRDTGAGQRLWPASPSEAPSDAPTLLRCPLAHQGLEVLAPLRYWSATGRHLFRFPLCYRPIGGTSRQKGKSA